MKWETKIFKGLQADSVMDGFVRGKVYRILSYEKLMNSEKRIIKIEWCKV